MQHENDGDSYVLMFTQIIQKYGILQIHRENAQREMIQSRNSRG